MYFNPEKSFFACAQNDGMGVAQVAPTKEECTMKKAWQKPRLVVLARCGPEEAVLCYCKYDCVCAPQGPLGDGCGFGYDPPNPSWECSAYSES